MNYGLKIKIKYTTESDYFRHGNKSDIFRNVTEIYYNYPSPLEYISPQIAFESDIHGTGCTKFIDGVKEFEATIEKSKAKSF